jgi:hypothetical protein
MGKLFLASFATLLIFSLACDPGFAQVRKKEKITVFEVPTTGKIMDVEYRPEFDEWWVKCREGDHISVYSYEPKTQSWGKVLFTPQKAQDKDKKAEKPKNPAISVKDKGPEKKPAQQAKAPEKEAAKLDLRKKWWDPLNILKEGEKLIIKPWSAEGAK